MSMGSPKKKNAPQAVSCLVRVVRHQNNIRAPNATDEIKGKVGV
jgi:hypothetical protein